MRDLDWLVMYKKLTDNLKSLGREYIEEDLFHSPQKYAVFSLIHPFLMKYDDSFSMSICVKVRSPPMISMIYGSKQYNGLLLGEFHDKDLMLAGYICNPEYLMLACSFIYNPPLKELGVISETSKRVGMLLNAIAGLKNKNIETSAEKKKHELNELLLRAPLEIFDNNETSINLSSREFRRNYYAIVRSNNYKKDIDSLNAFDRNDKEDLKNLVCLLLNFTE